MLYIGLLFIIAGWVVQFTSKNREVKPLFLLLYFVGTILLTLSAFLDRFILMGLMNLVTAALAFLLWRKLSKKGRR